MFFHQKLRVGLSSGLVGLLLAVAGCSSTRPAARVDAPAAPAAAAPSANPAPDPTATASATGNAGPAESTAVAPAETAQTLPRDVVNPSAPMRYTVKRGDTLWGISSMFLRDPWLWPEIWYDNPQIHNPHRIYPGDVLVLAYGADGRPRIYVESSVEGSGGGGGEISGVIRLEPRLRSSALEGAIPTIPYASIAAFLSRPTILSVEQVDHAPHVLAFRDEHQAAGENEEAYVRGLGDAPAGARFLVMHIGERLRDPDSGRLLGYQGLYTATAVVLRPGDPATVTLIEPGRETLRGDCLVPDDNGNPLNFVPRAPTAPVNGRIISVIDDVHAIAQYDIVAINRGTSQGVGPGTVLAVDQVGEAVADRGVAGYDKWGTPDTLAHSVRLPNERAGTLLVFKSYDDMSYALVVGASEQMEVADIVRNP
ncbi:MAG: LysM domain-containing protein [Steroidobacteraceae bacterium]